MLFIGIDLGTSSVKLLLTDENGKILGSVSGSYPVNYPFPGWSEQSPEDWYTVTIDCIKKLTADCDRTQIKGLAVAGQMHGLVTLDRSGNVIRPAILWNDGRSEKQTRYLNNVIGRDTLTKYTGNIAFAGFTAPKILWMKENEPELFDKIDKILLPKDYLIYRLTGEFATDPSDASGTLYYDVKNRRWSKEMLDILGIDEKMLPTVHESFREAGKLKAELCGLFGFSDVTVAAGAGDNAAAAVGCGAVGDGTCNLSLGTSGTLFLPSEEFKGDPNNALHAFAHADGGYHLMGCMLSAASCGKWWIEDILNTDDYFAEQELDKQNNVYFLPYLMGERSPHNDAAARGVFFGLSADTSRKDMTTAVYEGVTFGLKDSLMAAQSDNVCPTQTTICGGGAKSAQWRQLCADILGIPVVRPEVEEGPAYGAAILAMVAVGVYPTVKDAAKKLVKFSVPCIPNKDKAEYYNSKYATWKKLYPALKPLFPECVK